MYVAIPAQTETIERPLNYISLFSGGGGLDLALKVTLPNSRCVCYVENEITAVEILVARIAEGSLDDAPIWSDVNSFPTEWFTGGVDGNVGGIIGGFPCTDISVAGKQEGITKGKRSGLWREYAKIIRQVQPNWVFIENVPGLLSASNGGVVLGQLAQMGFDAQWGVVSAKGVGASHLRKRVFILAYKPGVGWGEGWTGAEGVEGGFDVGVEGGELANTRRKCDERRGEPKELVRTQGEAKENSKQRQWGGESTGGGSNAMEHPQRTQRGQNVDPGTGQGERENGEGKEAGGIGERGESVGDPNLTHGHGTGNRGERWRGEPANNCGELGHPLSPRLEGWTGESGDAGEEREAVERAGDCLGNSKLAGFRQVPLSGSGDGSPAELEWADSPLGLFAPGPDSLYWNDVLLRSPALRPALSQAEAKYYLRGMAPGASAKLDFEDRTDRLRATGNLVCPLQGAAAFIELLRRARKLA